MTAGQNSCCNSPYIYIWCVLFLWCFTSGFEMLLPSRGHAVSTCSPSLLSLEIWKLKWISYGLLQVLGFESSNECTRVATSPVIVSCTVGVLASLMGTLTCVGFGPGALRQDELGEIFSVDRHHHWCHFSNLNVLFQHIFSHPEDHQFE